MLKSPFELYKPAEIAQLIETAGVGKAKISTGQTLVLAMLAGAFISFGAAAYTMVMTGVDPGFGPARFLGGVVFSLGLILVIVGGAELFTGNALMVMAVADHLVSITALLRNWGIVFLGNAIGAVGVAILIAGTGLLDGAMGETAARIAEGKAALGAVEALTRGILCNALVGLAVWLSFAARTVTGKILATIWPISAFVLLGFEHSIANLYLLPQGALAGGNVPLTGALANLFWVTIGNIIGGGFGVFLAYRYAYRPGG